VGTTISASQIASGGSDSFTITFTPTANSVVNGTVTVYTNDCDEAVYTFSIKGTGYTPQPSSALHFDGMNDHVVIADP
jgi:hypothetical protein